MRKAVEHREADQDAATPATYYVRIASEGRFINEFDLTVADITENVFQRGRVPAKPQKKPEGCCTGSSEAAGRTVGNCV